MQYVVSLLFAAICYFIYSYVAVCMFCAVRCVIFIGFCLLFSNYSTYVLQYSLYVCFLVSYFCFLFCVFCVLLLFCVLFLLLYTAALSYFCTSIPTAATEWKPNCGKQISYIIYHIRSYPPYCRPFLYPQPEDAACRGDRDRFITVVA